MRIALLLIGDEILSGEREDLNAHYLIKKLGEKNQKLSELLVVPDEIEKIKSGILYLTKGNEFIITSGGLGLTPDDKTLEAIAKALNLEIKKDTEVKKLITNSLERLGVNVKPFIIEEFSRRIDNADVFPNKVGVAPCQHITFQNRSIFILPGVPCEFRNLLDNVVIKHIEKINKKRTEIFFIKGRESDFADILKEIEKEFSVKTASYPPAGIGEKYVKVKIAGKEDLEPAIKLFTSLLKERGIEIEKRVSA